MRWELKSEVLNTRGRLLLQPSLKSQSGQPLQLLKDINRRERKSSGKVTRLWMRSSERLSSRCMALGMATTFFTVRDSKKDVNTGDFIGI